MKFKNIILYTMLLLVLSSFGTAALTTEVEVQKKSIFPGEEAVYILHVTNNDDYMHTLEYHFPENTEWTIFTDPSYTQRNIDAGETIETRVAIKPFSEINYIPLAKKYELPVTVESLTSTEKARNIFEIFLRDPNLVYDYIPIVNVDVDVPTELDPRKDAEVKIRLDNRNVLPIADYTLEVISKNNPENNRVVILQLEPLGKASDTVTLTYSNILEPTTEEITIIPRIPTKNATFDRIIKKIEILPYNEISKDSKMDKSFLKTTETVSIFNDGNIGTETIHQKTTTLFKQFFTSAEPDYEVSKESGFRNLEWTLTIPPQESKSIQITTNYRPLFIIIILTAIGILVYYLERSPVVIRKETRKLTGHKGETSRHKILIHIKNRTPKAVDNITIIDTIPKIGEVEKDFAVGTLQPSKIIKHEKKGTLLKWEIGTLEPFEERIISFQMYSKLRIIGGLRLTPTIMKFKNKRGKLSKVLSNSVETQ